MITVRVKIHNEKLEELLTHIKLLDSDVIESIDYKLPKPKPPKTIHKPLADLIIKDGFIFHDDTKLHSMQIIAQYSTIVKMVEDMGLKLTKTAKKIPLQTIIKDKAIRYKVDDFKVKNEVVELTKGKSLSSNIMITRNIPLLFDYAIEHKKAKGDYCLITITGLDEPKEKEAFNTILKFISRKSFKLHKIEQTY